MPEKLHLLWDTSVVLPYYVPQATKNELGAQRAKIVLNSVRHHRLDAVCYIPNICVAEFFANLDRQAYSKWDSQINKQYGGANKTLDTRRYRSARKRFIADIHNGALFYQYELNRYHILALDLIGPVDKHRKFYRKGDQHSMGAFDLLVGAMAIHLAKVHGTDRFALLTCDRRMDAIFANACPNLNENTAAKLGLVDAAPELGFGEWSSTIYPNVIDLHRCDETELVDFFGTWPLKSRKVRNRAPKA